LVYRAVEAIFQRQCEDKEDGDEGWGVGGMQGVVIIKMNRASSVKVTLSRCFSACMLKEGVGLWELNMHP